MAWTIEFTPQTPQDRPADDRSARRLGQAGAAAVPPVFGSAAHRVERNVLFELLVDGRIAGCDVRELAARLGEPLESVQAAATALGAVGLAEISRQTVSAAPTARYFDTLWPIAI